MTTHDLHPKEDGKPGYFCTKCGWSWKGKPESDCPGIPRYARYAAPPELMTRTQLEQAGFKTTKKHLPAPIGCIWRQPSCEWLWLYNPAQAVKREAPTRTQLERIEKANAARANAVQFIQSEAAKLWVEPLKVVVWKEDRSYSWQESRRGGGKPYNHHVYAGYHFVVLLPDPAKKGYDQRREHNPDGYPVIDAGYLGRSKADALKQLPASFEQYQKQNAAVKS